MNLLSLIKQGFPTLTSVPRLMRWTLGLLDSDTELPNGISKYPFKIDIPFKLPSSFKNWCYGSIEYELKAFVKRHSKFDMSVKKVIILVAFVDLNTFLPALQSQSDYGSDRNVTNLCRVPRGRIMLHAVVSKRLFLRGETITLDINVVNLSGVTIKRVFGRIMKTLTTYFTNPHTSEEITREFVARSPNFPGVKKYEEKSFSLYIQVPHDLFIPNFRYSNLFKITYQMQVIAKLSGCRPAMVLQFKIYLGHIALSGLPVKYELVKPFIRGSESSSSSIKPVHQN